jgi:putative ABC transport system permease protein
MNPITRGVRNAFRNGVRTVSIVAILGLSIGLSLTMLVAQKAVDNKIKSVKASIGNTISISAAGVMGFQGGGDPLSQSSIDKLSSLSHVTSVSESISDQLSNSDSTSRQGTAETANTSLVSAIDAGTLGQRFGGGGSNSSSGPTNVVMDGGGGAMSFTPPVSAYGQTDVTKLNDTTITLKSGDTISGTADKDVALIGSTLATKNSLKVGSTFTAYGETITVAGIFDTGTSFSNNAVLFSLPTLQRLSSQTGDVTSATITIDSIANIDSVTSAVKSKLGSTADVTNSKTTAQDAIAPLDSVKTVSTFSLIGAVVAGAVIILLTMIMVVRERKKEIGVVKAIGGSNLRIISEFMVESLTLAILGAVVGLLIGVVGGQPVTKMLVSNSTSSSSTATQTQGSGKPTLITSGGTPASPSGAPSGRFQGIRKNSAVQGLTNIKTQIGWGILLDGFGAAVLISVIGSALAAGMIAKIRPSTVMRAE